MGWRAVLVLLAVQAVSLSVQPRAAAGDWLAPMLSPIFKAVCDVVDCGKGSCREDGNRTFGYVCECDAGWTKLRRDDHFRYLPCVIPDCNFSYSCFNTTVAPAPAPPPLPPSDHPLLEPCLWSYCGEGTCVKTSDFGHRCDCKHGFANLLNATNFPCIKECVWGADCTKMGLVLPGQSPSTSPSGQVARDANKAATRSPGTSMWILLLLLSVAIAPRT